MEREMNFPEHFLPVSQRKKEKPIQDTLGQRWLRSKRKGNRGEKEYAVVKPIEQLTKIPQ